MRGAAGKAELGALVVGLVIVAVVVLGAWWVITGDEIDQSDVPVGVVLSPVEAGDSSGKPMELPKVDSRSPANAGLRIVQRDLPEAATPAPNRLAVDRDALSIVVTSKTRAGISRPVAGADVLPVIGGQAGTRRKTNAAGRVQIPLGELVSAVVVVRAAGCFLSTTDAGTVAGLASSAQVLEVSLTRSYLLRGRVGAWGPDPVPAGIAVLAWSMQEPPTREAVADLLERERNPPAEETPFSRLVHQDVMLTRTQFGGGYRFPMRVPAGRWSLLAAGLGRATHGVRRVRSEASNGLQLMTWSAHSLAVQITDHQGVPLEETPGVSVIGYSWPQGSKLQYTAFQPAERLLLGIEVPQNWGPVRLIDVRAPEPAPTAGPVRLNLKYPGFEKYSESLDIPSTRGGLVLQSIALKPTWEELGELTVVLVGWGDHVGELAAQPLTSLDLTTDEGARQYVYLKDIADDRVHLGGLPHGIYHARLDVNGMYRPPKLTTPVEISATPATLRIDLTQFASLDIELVAEGGRPFDGWASIRMGLTEGSVPGAGYIYTFQRGPYRIPFLSLHKWRAQLNGAFGAKGRVGGQAMSPVVELSAGETGTVRLVIGGG